MTKLGQQLAISYYKTKIKLLSKVSKRKAAELAIDLFITPRLKEKLKLPKIFDVAEKLSFTHDGETVTGYRWNRGGRKKVLIVHGFNSSVVKFESYIVPLTQKGYEVLAFDAPAHGKSSGKSLNAVTFRDVIVRIHDEYGPVKSFMGHSFGGLAICLALEQIPHNDLYRAVLIAPATESVTSMKLFFEMMGIEKEVQDEFYNMIFEMGRKPAEWFSVSRALNHIQARILWCHDEDDKLTPWSDAKKVMDRHHGNIEFLITKGLGHRRIYKNSKVARAITEFL